MAKAAQKSPTKPKTAKRAPTGAAAKKAPTARKTASKATSAPKTAKPAQADPSAFAFDWSPTSFLLTQQDSQGFVTALGATTVEFTQANVGAAIEGTRELMDAKDFNEVVAVQTRLFSEGLERSVQQSLALQALAADAFSEASKPFAALSSFAPPRA